MKTILSALAVAFTLSATVFAGPPVNEKCPVCGKDGRLIFHSEVKGDRIIFATAKCKDDFDKHPGKFKVTKKS